MFEDRLIRLVTYPCQFCMGYHNGHLRPGRKAIEEDMALKEANGMQAARAKVGAFGGTGSGKTTTLSLLAAGVSKEFHDGAPIAFYSTEPGVDFVKPIFATEGIKLYEDRSKSFKDLLDNVKQAQQLGCCALIVDSITHVWRELVDSYCRKRNISKPEFHHWKDIKGSWGQWTDAFINAPIHIFVAGRAGNEYEYEENEDGKKDLVKGDTKMKAEGEFGYEADLLIELLSSSDKQAKRVAKTQKHQAPRMIHTALVRKSRVWELNGREFYFPDADRYELNGYKPVLAAFLPYFTTLNLAKTHTGIDTVRNSDSMFDREQGGDYQQRKRARDAALEEIESTMVLLLPGQDAKSKTLKIQVIESVFGTRSWTAVQNKPLGEIQHGRAVLREFETLVKQGAEIGTEEALKTTVGTAQQIVEEMEAAERELPAELAATP